MAAIELKALPPQEAIAFFRQKGYAVSFDHEDVWAEEHQAAFTAAKATQHEVLRSLRREVDRALADGVTFSEFSSTLEPRLQALGWWGRKALTDPATGETREVQLGSLRRLKTIYDTNLRTAHAEGQWERIQANSAAFPYLQYDGNNSAQPREEHAAWDGLVLPVDDPWWQAHAPVKAWGCKCRVRALTRGQVRRRGLKVSQAPAVPSREVVNRRTGEVRRVPEGVDPQFAYPLGGRREQLAKLHAERLAQAHPADAAAYIDDLVASPAFAEWLAKPKVDMPVMVLEQVVADAIGAATPVAVLSSDNAGKQISRHPELSLEEYRLLPSMGREPTVVVQDGDRSVVIVRQGRRAYWAAVKATQTGKGLFVTSFRRAALRDIRALVRRGRVVLGEW